MAPLVVSPPPLGSEELPGPRQLDRDCDRAVIEDWVFRAPHVATFLSVVIHRGFLLPRLSPDLAPLVPERHVDQERVFESILDVPSVIYVNAHLPREQRHRWHLLFSSELHGHSFAQLCGRITHQGPCVLLLEDRDGHVFGGFASCSWEVKPQFQGEIWPPKTAGSSTGFVETSGLAVAAWGPPSRAGRERGFLLCPPSAVLDVVRRKEMLPHVVWCFLGFSCDSGSRGRQRGQGSRPRIQARQ